jgi:hypothetical protein
MRTHENIFMCVRNYPSANPLHKKKKKIHNSPQNEKKKKKNLYHGSLLQRLSN